MPALKNSARNVKPGVSKPVEDSKVEALELVTQARLGGALSIGETDFVEQVAQVWASVLHSAQIPVEAWEPCLIIAMRQHTGHWPLHVGAIVAAYPVWQEETAPPPDTRALLEKMEDFRAQYGSDVATYPHHLVLARAMTDAYTDGRTVEEMKYWLGERCTGDYQAAWAGFRFIKAVLLAESSVPAHIWAELFTYPTLTWI